MKRLIFDLILALAVFLLLFTAARATEIGFQSEKQVNGDYKHALIVDFSLGSAYQAYFNTAAVFLAPRSNPLVGNHEYFEMVIGAKFTLPTQAVLDLSTSGRYYWQGNSADYPEGLRIDVNTASLTWKI